MDKQPTDLMLCNLSVLLMPNGEILCNGERIGYFENIGAYLTPDRWANGSEITVEEQKEYGV